MLILSSKVTNGDYFQWNPRIHFQRTYRKKGMSVSIWSEKLA